MPKDSHRQHILMASPYRNTAAFVARGRSVEVVFEIGFAVRVAHRKFQQTQKQTGKQEKIHKREEEVYLGSSESFVCLACRLCEREEVGT